MAIGTTAAILGSAAIGAAGSAYAGSQQASAAESAAQTQADAARRSAELQRKMFKETRQDLAPFRQGGTAAFNQLMDLYVPGGSGQIQSQNRIGELRDRRNRLLDRIENAGAAPSAVNQTAIDQIQDELNRLRRQPARDMVGGNAAKQSRIQELQGRLQSLRSGGGATADTSRLESQISDIDQQIASLQDQEPDGREEALEDFYTSPGYEFRLEEGQRALDRSAAARGRLNSGAQERRTIEFGQGMASQEFNNYANRLAELAQFGQNSAAQTGTFRQNAAQGIGNAITQQGAAQASGTVGSSNALTQGLSNVGFNLQSGLDQYLQNQRFNRLMGGTSLSTGANVPLSGTQLAGLRSTAASDVATNNIF